MPATALAAEAETPSSTPGSGWVAPESSTGDSGGGSSEGAQQGSSLGSGGSAPAPEPEPQPIESSPPPTPETSAPEPTAEEAASTTTSEGTSEVAEEQAAPPVAEKPEPKPQAELAGGTSPVGSVVLGESEASPIPLASPPASSESSDSGGFNLYSPAVSLGIVLAFVLAGLAGRFALQRWRRRKSYNREAAEWQDAVRRLEPEAPNMVLHRVAGDGSTSAPPAKVR